MTNLHNHEVLRNLSKSTMRFKRIKSKKVQCLFLALGFMVPCLLLLKKYLELDDTKQRWPIFSTLLTDWIPWSRSHVIPLSIVDQHHEVIPHWLRHVHLGHVKVQGNTLIHIDGHADLAFPEDVAATRNFKLSTTKYGLVQTMLPLMENNDVFIVSAILAGLIDQVIWLVPCFLYDEPVSENKNMFLGTTEIDGTLVYCACDENAATLEEKCFYTRRTGQESIIDIDKSNCSYLKSFMFSVLCPNATENITKLVGRREILLDIDEDYYSVQSDYINFRRQKISRRWLQKLNTYFETLYCPRTSAEEQFHNAYLQNALRQYLLSREASMDNRTRLIALKDVLLKRDSKLQFCLPSPGEPLTKKAIKLARMIHRVKSQHIELLIRAKFCLTDSPVFMQQSCFRICYGSEGIKSNFYKVDNFTLLERTAFLETELTKLFNVTRIPQLITIARSIRDGYTPRNMFRYIEYSLLSMLDRVFSKLGHTISRTYDSNLLFGREGWKDE